MESTISSLHDIDAEVRRQPGNFNFTDVISKFVGNDRYRKGYDKLLSGIHDKLTYVWEVLSAIGDDIGKQTYEHVLNYIDNICDIDTCKTQALKSMTQMYGISRSMLDFIDLMPLEIRNIIDIMSIDKKHLMQVGFVTIPLKIDMLINTGKEATSDADVADISLKRFVNGYTIENDFRTNDLVGDYALCADYGMNYATSKLVPELNIRLAKTYILSSISTDVDYDVTVEPEDPYNFDGASAMYADVSSYNTIQAFFFEGDSKIHAGMFRCKDTDLYLSSSNGIRVDRSHAISAIAYLRNFFTDLTLLTDRPIRFGAMFEDMYHLPEVLSDETHAEVLSSIADYSAISSMRSDTTNDFSYVQDDITFNNVVIDDAKFHDYLSAMYMNALSGMCTMHYVSNSYFYLKPIYAYISADLLGTKKDDSLSSETRYIKLKNSIDLSFNESDIADAIEQGLDSLDNYDGVCKQLIEDLIAKRNAALPKAVDELTTRTSYYRERKVKEVFDFIENSFYGAHESMMSCAYLLDDSYIETDSKKNVKLHLLSDDGKTVNLQMLQYVANDLADLTLYVASLRQSLKSHALKYYMKGTFNLLAFTVNEYLTSLVKHRNIFNDLSNTTDVEKSVVESVRSKLSAHMFDDIEIVEYDDKTEYFNLACDTTSKARAAAETNSKFWTTEGTESNPASNLALSDDDISNFYLKTMHCKDKITDVNSFLESLFEVGADDSYIDAKTSALTITGSAETSAEHFGHFVCYSGSAIGSLLHYNFKNTAHPSFLVHPFLKNFIEAYNIPSIVSNAFVSDNTVAAAEKMTAAVLANSIGKFGQVIDIWKSNAYDFTGYKTKYEATDHTVSTDRVTEVIGYEGAFYPPAVEAYVNDTAKFISSVATRETTADNSSYYDKYYKHLNLNDVELSYLVCLLSSDDSSTYTLYKRQIADIVLKKLSEADVYDIFKYAEDRFGNMYILYKKYSSANPTQQEKNDTLGQLWIRLKDHPIAFPAFSGKFPVVDMNASDVNGKLKYLASDIAKYDGKDVLLDNMQYIYDFELDAAKRVLFLNTYPVNSPKYADVREHRAFYKTWEHPDILICNIAIGNEDGRSTLQLTEDTELRYDTLDNPYMTVSINATGSKVINSFLGYVKSTTSVAAVYATKDVTSDYTKHLAKSSIKVMTSSYAWHTKSLLQVKSFTLPVSIPNLNEWSYADDNIVMSHTDDDMTFATLIISQDTHNCRSIIGQETGVAGRCIWPNDTADREDGSANTFDSFDKLVLTIDALYIGNILIEKRLDLYNINSDASYIPQYSGRAGKSLISDSKTFSTKVENALQLLGWSADGLGAAGDQVNPADYDKTYDLDSLYGKIPGRVYEDYSPEDDIPLTAYSNPPIYTGAERIDYGDKYVWNIDLSSVPNRYLSCLKVMTYNIDNVGRSPYFSGCLSDLLSGDELYAINYISSDNETEVQVSSSVADVKIAGTIECFSDAVSKQDPLHIAGISAVSFKYLSSESALQTSFWKSNPSVPSHILSKTIATILYNPSDLRLYEYYHYIDERGIVKLDCSMSCFYPGNEFSDLKPYYHAYVCLSDLGLSAYALSDEICALSTIVLSDYNDLADVDVFKGFSNLMFKYSDEDVFLIDDPRFYYPGLNDAFPRIDESIIGFKKIDKMSKHSDLFNDKNAFVFKLDSTKDTADLYGDVQLPIQIAQSDCVQVFEDYDSAYGPECPVFLSCIEFYVDEDAKTCETVIEDGKQFLQLDVGDLEVSTVISSYDEVSCIAEDLSVTTTHFVYDVTHVESTIDGILSVLASNGYHAACTEDKAGDYERDFLSITIDSSNVDLSTFLDIHVGYEFEDDGITLYFNYNNLINTPFVKFRDSDGKVCQKDISTSYLKLRQGQSGLLDIFTQVKAYNSEELYALADAKLVTYKIFNISDDKPKFVIYKTAQAVKDSIKLPSVEAKAIVDIQDTYIDLEHIEPTEVCMDVDVSVHLSANAILDSVLFKAVYVNTELDFLSASNSKFSVERDDAETGTGTSLMLALNIKSKGAVADENIVLKFLTRQTQQEIVAKGADYYQVDAVNATAIADGKSCLIKASFGSVMLGQTVML